MKRQVREPKAIPGLTKGLVDFVFGLLAKCYGKGMAPTRVYIVKELRQHHPELVHPRVEVTVALLLNDLVDREVLKREDGKFYTPGDEMRKRG